jgi:hypothetical protein
MVEEKHTVESRICFVQSSPGPYQQELVPRCTQRAKTAACHLVVMCLLLFSLILFSLSHIFVR